MATDNANPEGTQASQADSSNQGNGQSSSKAPEYITFEQFNQLQSQLSTLQRSLQSDKDRAVKNVKQEVEALKGDLMTVLQAAKSGGKSVDDLIAEQQAQEEAEYRQVMKSMAQMLQTGQFPQASQGNVTQPGVNVSDVVKELELPADDLRVKDFMLKQFPSKEAALVEGAKLIKSISRQPTSADIPAGESGRAQNATQLQQLQAEYEEKAKPLRGQALINLKQEYRKKGLRSIS